MRWSHVWVLGLVACGDPQIHLTFPIPAEYAALTDAVTLKIYEPPAAEPFTCEDLAFGAADPDVVRISLASELPARDDVVPLTGIDRVGSKLFLAEGVTTDGRRLIVGCQAVGTIENDTDVELVARPTTRVRVNSRPTLARVLGRPLDGPIVLRVTDARSADPEAGQDEPLLGVDVRWQVVGSGGSGASGEAVSNAMGDVAIMPALPTRAGPYQLDVKVAWAESPPEGVSGFVSPPPEQVRIPARTLAYQAGRIGPNGEPGLAALLVDQLRSVKVALIYRSPSTGEILQQISDSIAADAAVLGLLDVPGRNRDRPVVITRTSWLEVGADASLIPRATYQAPISPPRRAVPFGDCSATRAPELLVIYGSLGDTVSVYEDDGTRRTGFAGGIDVLASGCVADQTGTEFRTLVIDDLINGGLQIAAELQPSMFAGLQWFAVAFGMSFVEPLGDSPGLLLGTQLLVNDFVVARLGLDRLDDDRFELSEIGLDAPPSVPQANRGGDLDGDRNLDVVSLFGRPSGLGQPVQFAVWAALHATLDGRRLAGEFDVGQPTSRAPELFVLDLDLDGIDDVITAEMNGEDAGATSTAIEIYSMGLTAE
ncbi:MAG: hypothetical protein IPG45_14400 [Deltaproteobacteria bacterium]|jgi:hypothetical protein|nr:hypothetical protein [Deltaproteobacteria bacterium]